MFHNVSKTLAAALLAAALPVSAATVTPTAFAVPLTPAKTSVVTVKGDREQNLEEKAFSAIKSGRINIISQGSLAYDRTVTNKVTKNGVTNYAVTIPLAHPFALTSNATIVFDKSGNLAQYSETHVTKNEKGNFRIEVFVDGKKDVDHQTNVRFRSDEEILKSTETPLKNIPQPRSVGSTVSCLAAITGIGGVAAYLIAGACAGSCAAAETGVGAAICAACIGAYATLGAGGMSAAAACFK